MSQSPRSSTESLETVKIGLLDHESILDNPFCSNCHAKRRSFISIWTPWVLSLFLCISLITSEISRALLRQTQNGAVQDWRESDFITAKQEIHAGLHTVHFDASLEFNSSHLVYRPATNPAYVGTPSKEIDDAWEALIGAVNVFVTPAEQELLGGDLWLDTETGLYTAEVTVTHNLHCLNFIRKGLHMEHYPEINHWPVEEHINHCIDALRLSIMCAGDMTLIPIKWSKNRNWINPSFDIDHTCRNYNALREWAVDRDSANEATYHQNAERLREKHGIKFNLHSLH